MRLNGRGICGALQLVQLIKSLLERVHRMTLMVAAMVLMMMMMIDSRSGSVSRRWELTIAEFSVVCQSGTTTALRMCQGHYFKSKYFSIDL